jgi:hypothetical protein
MDAFDSGRDRRQGLVFKEGAGESISGGRLFLRDVARGEGFVGWAAT